jgi:aminopeptidase N
MHLNFHFSSDLSRVSASADLRLTEYLVLLLKDFSMGSVSFKGTEFVFDEMSLDGGKDAITSSDAGGLLTSIHP